jgi:hypothetical protein
MFCMWSDNIIIEYKETCGDAKVNILLHFGLRLNSVYGYSMQEVYELARGHLVRKTALNGKLKWIFSLIWILFSEYIQNYLEVNFD